MKKIIILLFLVIITCQSNIADTLSSVLNVFIDCSDCDHNFIKQEIPYISYVRDRMNADVIILVTSESIGRNGRKYYFDFIGQHAYQDFQDKITVIISSFESEHIKREKITDTIRLGLVRYLIRTPLKDSIRIKIDDFCLEHTEEVTDNWNNWVFQIYFRPDIRGEESRKSTYFYTQINADRVTEDIKAGIMAWNNNQKDIYEIDGNKYEYTSKSYGLQGHLIQSLNNHWSGRVLSSISSSTYNNYDKNLRKSIGLEYNIFPYTESNRRAFTLVYLFQYNNIKYNEETIYFKVQEDLLSHIFISKLLLKQKWGSASFRLLASNYLHDFNKYRVELSNSVSLYLVEGLSVTFANRYSKINDLLNLPSRGASPEEVLLQRRQLETQYSYRFDITLRYIFGSKTSNIVNTRFDIS